MTGPGKDPWGNTRVGFSLTGEIDRETFGLTWNQAAGDWRRVGREEGEADARDAARAELSVSDATALSMAERRKQKPRPKARYSEVPWRPPSIGPVYVNSGTTAKRGVTRKLGAEAGADQHAAGGWPIVQAVVVRDAAVHARLVALAERDCRCLGKSETASLRLMPNRMACRRRGFRAGSSMPPSSARSKYWLRDGVPLDVGAEGREIRA